MEISSTIEYSVVIPVFNSQEIIYELSNRINKEMQSSRGSFELILVDDGSGDQSWEELKRIKEESFFCRIYRLSDNFGQYAATLCGIQKARGEYVITIDDDGQYKPEDILRMIKKIREEDLSLIYGYSRTRPGSGFYRMSNKVAAFILHYFFLRNMRKKIFFTSFRIFRRSLFTEPPTYSALKMDIDSFLSEVADPEKVGFLEVEHLPRKYNKSGYTFFKKLVQFYNSYLIWAKKPVKYLYLSGVLLLIIITGSLLLFRNSDPLYFQIILIFLIFIALTCISVISVYVAKIYQLLKGKPYYIISEKVE